MPATQRGGPGIPPGSVAAAGRDGAGGGPAQAPAEGAPLPGRGETRRIYLIDREFQLREVNRAVTVFVVLIGLQVALFIGVAQAMRQGILDEISGPSVFVGVAFAVPMLLCLVYSWILLRRSHRVAGAAYRLRHDIPNVVRDPGFRFRLRKDDYLQSLAHELNKVMDRIEAQQADLVEAQQALAALRDEIAPLRDRLPSGRARALDSYLDELDRALAAARLLESPPPNPDTPGSRPPDA